MDHLQKTQRKKETGDSRYIYQNELDKACLQHEMAYGHFKDLNRRRAADKALRDKAFNIAKNPKYDGYQRGFVSLNYKFFDKKSALLPDKSASGSGIKNENMSDEQLAEELHKAIIGKFEKRKVHAPFILGAHLADMQLTSTFSKGICFLLCVIDIYSKYAWVIPLIDKKGITITNAFQKT